MSRKNDLCRRAFVATLSLWKPGGRFFRIEGGRSLRFATIHRAAYRYYYQNNAGMRQPYLPSAPKIKLCYQDKSGTGVFWGGGQLGFGVLPDIEIYGKDTNGNYWAIDRIFSTTAHELTHAAHYKQMGNINYWQVKMKIYESWADFGEWVVTMREYTERGLTGNNMTTLENRLTYQWWPYTGWGVTRLREEPEYSPIFIDLIDNFNQSTRNTQTETYPNDDVTGYTVVNLNNLILDVYNSSDLKTKLKANKPLGVTDTQIDNLLLRYNSIW